jgi:glycosyltransferase involved in cell wall biosynthesis
MNTRTPKSILFLTKYSRRGASSRYRTFQYLPYLEDAGFRCEVSPLFGDDYLEHLYRHNSASWIAVAKGLFRRIAILSKIKQYDLLVIEKELFPYLPFAVNKCLSRSGIRQIVDYDDALFHQYDSHPCRLVRYFMGNKIARVMRGADLVVAGNNYLATYAKEAGSDNVCVLPTVVDLGCHPLRSREGISRQGFTIGWIGSPSTARYLEPIAPALAQVCAGGKARVVLIGSGPCSLPGVPLEIMPWGEATEAELLSLCDVGIMPLPDKPWERGKCGLKLIQYMASGLPVVASPVGVNVEIVEEDINGYLATDNATWVETLVRLREDSALRARLGDAGRQKAEKSYSLEVQAPRLVQIIESTLEPSSACDRQEEPGVP